MAVGGLGVAGVGSFANTADFGKGPLTTLGTVDSVLVKTGPACEVVCLTVARRLRRL